MKRILPINPNPYFHSYTQHGYFHAITSSEDKVTNDINDPVAEIEVSDYEKYNWKNQRDRLNYNYIDGKLRFFANKWNTGMNMAFLRKCKEFDELSVTIHKQLYSNAWSSITLFISSNTGHNITNMDSHDVVVGHFEKDGIFYSVEKGIHNRLDDGRKKPITIKIIKRENDIYMSYYDNNFSSDSIFIHHLDNSDDEYSIGFAINLDNSIYHEWVFSNYIQLFARPKDIIPIDYIVNPHKDWCVHTSNTLIDYHRIKIDDIKVFNISTLEYIKRQIDLGNYIESEINDNLNFQVSDELKGKHFHQNLIYGYDDDKEIIYTLYYNQGQVSKGNITYKDYESERNNGGSKFLYMMKYNPCSEHFAINTKRIRQLYKEYNNSENISLYESFFQDGFMEGLSCYQYFTIGEGAERTKSDVRIVYLLYERANCNKDRIEYLYEIGALSSEKYKDLIRLIDYQIEELGMIKNLIIKQRMQGNKKTARIMDYLEKAFSYEKEFVNTMIDSL